MWVKSAAIFFAIMIRVEFLYRLAALSAVLTPFICPVGAVPSVKLEPVYENMDTPRPIAVLPAPDQSGRLFLVQQRGQIRLLPKDTAAKEAALFLDLSGRRLEADKTSEFEEGLLGFAFHPKFAENRKFYLYYTRQNPKRAVLTEMSVAAADANKADVASERILLEFPLPFWNHHSGNLAFGQDGMLYVAVGDGGGPQGGDPLRTSQNTILHLGKILRIDVNKKTGDRAFGIPSDNPFVGKPGYLEEIYALGTRNPWGMAFDAAGTLFFADVGQNLFEEINVLEKGGNYGWSYREGLGAFPQRTDTPAEGTTFVDPIHIYSRDQGISITGGFFYEGKKLPELKGTFIYGDWGSGRIWALRYDRTSKMVMSNDLLAHLPGDARGKGGVKPTGFGPDLNGEILVLCWNGKIYRIAPAS